MNNSQREVEVLYDQVEEAHKSQGKKSCEEVEIISDSWEHKSPIYLDQDKRRHAYLVYAKQILPEVKDRISQDECAQIHFPYLVGRKDQKYSRNP